MDQNNNQNQIHDENTPAAGGQALGFDTSRQAGDSSNNEIPSPSTGPFSSVGVVGETGTFNPIYSDTAAAVPSSPTAKDQDQQKNVEVPPITSPSSSPFVVSQASSGQNVSPSLGNDLKSDSLTSVPVSPKPTRKFPIRLFLILILVVGLIVGLVFAYGKFLGKKTVETKTLTWWNLWEDESIVKPLIAEYESKNPNVKINYIKQSPQDYRERLSSVLAKGEGPDIFVFHNTWVPLFVRELDAMPASFSSAADIAQNYYYVVSADLSSQGRILGIPLGYDALTLFINEDLFKEAGLNPPETWVDLRNDAKILTKTENGKIIQAGVALGRTENVDHWQEILALMMIQNGVNFTNPDISLVENSLMFYTIFSKTDRVWDETLPSSTEAFASGKLAMYFGPSWRAFNIKDANPNLNFRTIPIPQVPKENPDDPDISYATYWAQGVWSKGKNKDLAWDFLKFLSSKDSLEKLFKQASLQRGFGQAYPRSDMANLILDHPILGSIVKLAPNAKSWYLASRTFDGPTGINSQLSKYFEDAVNAINNQEDPENTSDTLAQGIKQVLTQYGLSK